MNDEDLDNLDQLLLPYAFDSKLADKLYDIMNSKPRNISRDMSVADIHILSNYIAFPRNAHGAINIKSARETIERFLIVHPFFQRENSETTRKLIVSYYESHPELPRPKPDIPNWYQKLYKLDSTNKN